jgi:hypothetical protein
MLNILKNKFSYSSIAISVTFFILLNFILGPTSLFGLANFVLNKTGYFFGVDINTFDYLLISSIPICAIMLTEKRNKNSLLEILKYNIIILLNCIITFSVGLFILLSKIGSPSSNPLIPQYLRVEPFKFYSIFFIAIGLTLPFLFVPKEVKQIESEIGEIGSEIGAEK